MLESGLAKETQWYVRFFFYKCVSCILVAVSEDGRRQEKIHECENFLLSEPVFSP